MDERIVSEVVHRIRSGDAAAADDLPEVLAQLPVNEPSRVMLRRLLDGRALDGRSDAFGVPCRAALIAAQLKQGYPWALEVSPDDLQWMRRVVEVRARRVNHARWGTMALALGSLYWNGSGLLAAFPTGQLLFFTPFAIATAHALIAVRTAWRARADLPRADRAAAAHTFRILGAMALVGPAASAVLSLTFGDLGLIAGMVVAVPAMATAFACLVAGDRILPEAK